jgi:hypothetical protein
VQGGSRTLYFVLADVDVRRGLDDVACEVEDHVDGILQSCPYWVEEICQTKGILRVACGMRARAEALRLTLRPASLEDRVAGVTATNNT